MPLAANPSAAPVRTILRCARLEKDVSAEEPRCLDPKAYCKHRSACPIHLLEKEAARARR